MGAPYKPLVTSGLFTVDLEPPVVHRSRPRACGDLAEEEAAVDDTYAGPSRATASDSSAVFQFGGSGNAS